MRTLLPLLLLAVPGALQAQVRTTVSTYAATDAALPGEPLLLGVAVGREVWHVGVRAGIALDSRLTPAAEGREGADHVGSWSADVDGLVFLRNPSGRADLVPYALAGVGYRSAVETGRADRSPTWSYGGGVRMPLASWVGIEAEGRYRQSLEGEAEPGVQARRGMEFRLGMGLRFGGAAAAPRPVPTAPRPSGIPLGRPAAASAGSAADRSARLMVAERALAAADDHLGVRYTWGGNTPRSGFDCSGFVRYVYMQQGIDLPRVSRDQARAGVPLPLDIAALEPGDLIAFASDRRVVDHIAIYAGGGQIIHSSASGNGVRFDDLYSERGRWYREHMVAARRVIGANWGYASGR